MSSARFELYEDKAGEWRWRLIHRNGNIIADSGEGYASKQKAQQGARSVKDNAAGAPIGEGSGCPHGGCEEPVDAEIDLETAEDVSDLPAGHMVSGVLYVHDSSFEGVDGDETEAAEDGGANA